MPSLSLCVSQQINDAPYQFKVTGLRVFSFEEALYHVYHYWKQSADDFLSRELIDWVNDTLGLSYIASRMASLTQEDSFQKRMAAFLKLVDYFSAEELAALNAELIRWEKRREWEKLKERADYLMGRGEPEKAATLYRRALQYEENAALLNNLGIAYMRMEAYGDALKQLTLALEAQTAGEERAARVKITLHAAEAAICGQQFTEAERLLGEVEKLSPNHKDIPFLKGLSCYIQNDYAQSIRYYEEAINGGEGNPDPYYLYSLADVYVKMRQYEKALTVMEQISEKDVTFYVKQAELHAVSNHLPAAIKSVQAALLQQNSFAELWTKLAMYHRLDYDLPMANAAISRALAIDPENERAKLESARIKKGMGRTREYQSVLNSILGGFRRKYRELGG